MVEVDSSQIESIGYDIDEKILAIKFTKALYYYEDVPKMIYDDMLEAESVGRFFAAAIKGKFGYQKMD